MNYNDQWFEPGDKVMRVQWAEQLGFSPNGIPRDEETRFGRVLCVEQCWFDALWNNNSVTFVGIPNDGESWFACCFRKIEEIKLCTKAADKSGETIKANAELSSGTSAPTK